ncbi:hypothetical protein LXA43DRAFT_906539, partial [Ganoderma leucocontextum]
MNAPVTVLKRTQVFDLPILYVLNQANPAQLFDSTNTPTFILAGLLMVTILHTLSDIARPDAAYALSVLKVVIFGVFAVSNTTHMLSSPQHALLLTVPDDLRTVLTTLGVEPNIIRYASC